MKILKIFGVVVGIHVFALILIFANPGCSSTTKPPASETVAKAEPTGPVSVPNIAPAPASGPSSATPPPLSVNLAGSGSTDGRRPPTRPGSTAPAVFTPEPPVTG